MCETTHLNMKKLSSWYAFMRFQESWYSYKGFLVILHMWQEHGLREKKMFLGGSFLKLADDNKYIKNPEAQNRALRGF